MFIWDFLPNKASILSLFSFQSDGNSNIIYIRYDIVQSSVNWKIDWMDMNLISISRRSFATLKWCWSGRRKGDTAHTPRRRKGLHIWKKGLYSHVKILYKIELGSYSLFFIIYENFYALRKIIFIGSYFIHFAYVSTRFSPAVHNTIRTQKEGHTHKRTYIYR